MGFLFSGLFWGGLLVLLGASVILKAVFHIHFPVFRLVLGLIVIYFGVRIMVGHSWHRYGGANTVIFDDAPVAMAAVRDEYSIIFGKGTIDATDPGVTDKNRRVEVNTVFGQSTVRISSSVPTVVRVSAAFSGARLPDGNLISFGEYTYRNKACDAGGPQRTIRVNVVFGGCDVVELQTSRDSRGRQPPDGASADSSTVL